MDKLPAEAELTSEKAPQAPFPIDQGSCGWCHPIEVAMFRMFAVCCLAAGMTAGCAETQRVTSGGYYCIAGTEQACPEHEGYGDCQLCPSSSLAQSKRGPGTLR